MAARVRSSSPSLSSRLLTWVLTVFSLITIFSAIWRLVRPRAICSSTSRSRSVSACSAAGRATGFSGLAAALRDRRHQPAGNIRVQLGLALGGFPQRLHKLARLDIFEQIPVRPGADGREDFVIFAEAGQDQHLHLGVLRQDLLRGFHPIHVRHAQIQQDHVRVELRRQLHRLQAAAALPNHLHVLLHLDEQAQPLAHHGVVIHQQHTDLSFLGRKRHFLAHNGLLG